MKSFWLPSQLAQSVISIEAARQTLMAEGYSAKQANQLTLEMLRVKGQDIEWTD